MCCEVMHKADDRILTTWISVKKFYFLINLKEAVVWLLLFLTEIFIHVSALKNVENTLEGLLLRIHTTWIQLFIPFLVCQASIACSMF